MAPDFSDLRRARRSTVALVCGLAATLMLWPRPALAAGLSDEAFLRIITLIGVIGVGYVITHLAVERIAQRFSVAGGVEYVALGVTLGPVLGILDQELARDIRPVLLLGSGALALLAGLELGKPETSGVSTNRAWAAAGSITLLTAITVLGIPLLLLLAFGYEIEGDYAWTAALLFAGVVALGSDGALIGNLAASLGATGPAAALGAATATRVRAFATLGFGLLFAMLDNGSILDLRPWPSVVAAMLMQIGAGVVLGLLFGVVVHRKLDERTLLTVVVGMVFLGGGFAYAMHVSTIFVMFVAGLAFALTSTQAAEATRTMRSIKQPFVIALYFFAGLEWVTGELWVYAMLIPFVALRWTGRKLGGAIGAAIAQSPANLGPATAAPGGLALAFVINVVVVYRDVPGIKDAYGPLLVILILLELYSLRAARRWLVDAAGIRSVPVAHATTPRPH